MHLINRCHLNIWIVNDPHTAASSASPHCIVTAWLDNCGSYDISLDIFSALATNLYTVENVFGAVKSVVYVVYTYD